MSFSPSLFSQFIQSISTVIETNAEEVTALDQAIGDGDHVTNLQRGLEALAQQSDAISQLDWAEAFKKTGMTILSSVGGASGSLYGTLFITMSKTANNQPVNLQHFAEMLRQGVDAVKRRGKADLGEKTMLDVLIPVSEYLQNAAKQDVALPEVLEQIKQVAVKGMESTRDLVATKGRASYLGERSKGHIDAGARTSQLMICTIADVLREQSTTPT
ncbi:MAG TPA: dihydroxyacetone kinase subunit L [Crenotrichaceae bacterium]|nr:dihydroxyacetone kinase subunit L [Crenotrichaceae bacterium]